MVSAAVKEDIAGTATLMEQFVSQRRLPSAYDELHGGIKALINSRKFPDDANSAMRSLIDALRVFQHEAFLMGYDADSWGIRDIVQNIAELTALAEGPACDALSQDHALCSAEHKVVSRPFLNSSCRNCAGCNITKVASPKISD